MGTAALTRGLLAMCAALLLALVVDGVLLLRATMDQAPDAIPPQVSLIVVESWASDAATRQAFALAQRFEGARVISVGSLPEREWETEGACFQGASVAAKTRAQLLAWGLPPARVVSLEQSARGTHNEALQVLAWMRANVPDADRLIVVTEWFHRQRSRLAYRTAMPGLDVRVSGAPPASGLAQWPERERRTALFSEFLKLGYYQFRGWVSPAQLLQAQARRG